MAQAQKPDFVFRRNGRVHLEVVHLNRRGASVHSTTGSRGVRISGSNGSNAGYTMFQGSMMSTGYPLHSPVSLSLPLPCVTVCHHISTGVYLLLLAGQKDKWVEPGNLRTGAYFQFSFFFINGSSDLLFIRDTEFNLTRWAARICVP
jgi:hypothetical protein